MRNSRTLSICVGLVALVVFGIDAAAQGRITALGTQTAVQVNDRVAKAFSAFPFPKADRGVDLKKVSYTTRDAKGKIEPVTGLLILPRGGAEKGLVVYMHGTTWDFKNAPSRVLTHKDQTYAELFAFAAAGYAVAAPDYIGLGDSKPTHPYPLNIVNGRSGVDIIKPVRNFARASRYSLGKDLYVTGYSEGGGTAMGMLKLLEESGDPDLRPTKGAPASGPYDLTGVTRDFLLAEAKGTDLVTRAFLLGYTISYFKDAFGVKTSDYFQKSMATTVNINFKRGKSDKSIGLGLIVVGAITGGTKSRDSLLTPRFIRALEDLDMNDPVIREMSKNNVYDWSPRTPMLIISLATDRVVDPGNAHKAVETMRRRGVGRNTMRHLEINNPALDHGSVVPEATYNTLRFFDAGFEAVPGAK
ncbi:MAG TPA: lipase family protein [Pyrinomonadaceae bacterium]|nr:lipase family protein [Pyrinomonadaceae bacterium]